MESITTYLQEHPFFKGFSAEHIEKISCCASEISFNPEQYIFRDGGTAQSFYLIQQGLVSLEVHVPNRGPVTIERISSGDVLGWSWLYPPHRWHFDARSLEETHSLVLNGEDIRRLIDEDHEFGFQMMRKIALIMENRLQATRVKMMEVYDIYRGAEKTRPKWHDLI